MRVYGEWLGAVAGQVEAAHGIGDLLLGKDRSETQDHSLGRDRDRRDVYRRQLIHHLPERNHRRQAWPGHP
jgi:hypothetical protein